MDRKASMVEFMEDMLKYAKAGALRAFVGTGVGMDGQIVGGFCRGGDREDLSLMLGESVCLQHRLCDMLRNINDGEI